MKLNLKNLSRVGFKGGPFTKAVKFKDCTPIESQTKTATQFFDVDVANSTSCFVLARDAADAVTVAVASGRCKRPDAADAHGPLDMSSDRAFSSLQKLMLDGVRGTLTKRVPSLSFVDVKARKDRGPGEWVVSFLLTQ